MQLTITNFRKVETAEIDINTLTLIAGHNEAGKSSIAQAVGAALTGNLNVMGVAKKEAHELVRDGANAAGCRLLAGDKGENGVIAKWPEMIIDSKGLPPKSSDIAAGLVRFSSLSAQDAAKKLLDVLKAHPTKDDFLKVAGALASQKTVEGVWSMIERDGWDTAHNYLLEQARNLKAEWKVITGENWGSQKAETWRPASFLPELEAASDEQLVQESDQRRAELEQAIATDAVDDDYIKQLEEKANKLKDLQESYKGKRAEIDAINAELNALVGERSAIPEIQQGSFPCPHCQGMIALRRIDQATSQYVKAEEMPDKEKKAIRARVAELDGGISNLKLKLAKLNQELGVIKFDGQKAKEAKDALNTLGGRRASADSKARIDALRAAHEETQRRIDAFRKYTQATNVNKRLASCLAVAEQVSPSGLRQRKAGEAVEDFNKKHLAPLSEQFGIKQVSIDLNMDLFLGTRRYRFLSESAKYRVDIVLQVAIARLEPTSLIVIDGADIIVPSKSRVGLLKMLLWAKIPALVCMSLSEPENTPNLKGYGGSVYWMENSVAQKLEEKSA